MDWITPYRDYLIAAVVVLAVLVLLAMVAKAVGGRVRGRRGSRLGISEYYEVDKTRRLILVRRDGVEHLVMIGGDHDLVIETGIGGAEAGETGRRAARGEDVHEEEHPLPGRPPPRPAVFGDRTPLLRPVGREEPRLSARNSEEDERA